MDYKYNRPNNNRYKCVRGYETLRDNGRSNLRGTLDKKNDDDLIIEENTIYEIDRDCAERFKRNREH